jgi:hypothetical protein
MAQLKNGEIKRKEAGALFGGSPGSMKKKKVLSKVVPFAHLIIYSHFVVIL